jgi:hypothetical protein
MSHIKKNIRIEAFFILIILLHIMCIHNLLQIYHFFTNIVGNAL